MEYLSTKHTYTPTVTHTHTHTHTPIYLRSFGCKIILPCYLNPRPLVLCSNAGLTELSCLAQQ